jgi:hypothetical protein
MTTTTATQGPKGFVPAGLFKQIQGKRASGGVREYFPEGDFFVKLKSCKFDHAKFDKKDLSPTAPTYEFFTADFEILEATNCASETGKPGRICNYWTGKKGMIPYLENLRNFIGSAYHLSDRQIDALGEEMFNQAMQSLADQECSDFIFEVHAYRSKKDMVIPVLRSPALAVLQRLGAPKGQLNLPGYKAVA